MLFLGEVEVSLLLVYRFHKSSNIKIVFISLYFTKKKRKEIVNILATLQKIGTFQCM